MGSRGGPLRSSSRHYARPPYSIRSGTPAPVSRPELEKVKQPAPGSAVKWHRSVMRFPTAVTVELTGRKLLLSGKAGSLKLDLTQLDPTGLVAFKFLSIPIGPAASADSASSAAVASGGGPAAALATATSPVASQSMMVLVSTDKERFLEVSDRLEQAVHGVMQGYLVGLTVKGVGYRLEPYEGPLKRTTSWYFEKREVEKTNITYPFPRPTTAVRCKVGYSCAALFPLPPGVRAFFLKPTIMYLYGLKLAEVEAVAASIRAVRKPNTYTGNGIQRLDEVVKLKARAGSK
ncbi:MAG: hypothetical protein WDW36_009813 [Sanguina aurantia]